MNEVEESLQSFGLLLDSSLTLRMTYEIRNSMCFFVFGIDVYVFRKKNYSRSSESSSRNFFLILFCKNFFVNFIKRMRKIGHYTVRAYFDKVAHIVFVVDCPVVYGNVVSVSGFNKPFFV